jgi:hypothetical protein
MECKNNGVLKSIKGRMMKKMIFLFCIMSNLWSKSLDLEVTAKIQSELSTKYIAFIELNLANNTEEWISLDNEEVSFGEHIDKYIKVLNSEKLEAYFDYLKLNQEENKKNSSLFSIALSFVNPYVGIAYDTNSLYNSNDKIPKLERNTYPKGHLYNTQLIPPGATVKRFFIISSKNHKDYGYLNSFKFLGKKVVFRKEQYRMEDSGFGTQNKIKSTYTWQSDI